MINFCNLTCVISGRAKQFFDFVCDVSAKLIYHDAAVVGVTRHSSDDACYQSLNTFDKQNLSNTAVMEYSSCSRFVGGCWLDYCLCVEQLLRWFGNRPLLHIWRLVERRAHRKEFRRKSVVSVFSLCASVVLCEEVWCEIIGLV